MPIQHLTHRWDSGKLAPAWIIGTADIERTLAELRSFIHQIMGQNDLPLENNPDFCIIKREPNTTGNLSGSITVDQIRDLQAFFSTTRAVSQYKVAIINEAETMNVNASNCCLKILEDTPNHGFIFLVTSSPSNLLPTIRSRCQRLHIPQVATAHDTESYTESLEYIRNNEAFLQKLSGKIDKSMVQNFGKDILHFLSRVIKNTELAAEERSCSNLFKGHSIKRLLHKFEVIQKIFKEFQEFELDPRASFVLMREELCLPRA